MDSDDDTLHRFRDAVRKDLADGEAKPLRSYLRAVRKRFTGSLAREYVDLVRAAKEGWSPTGEPELGPAPPGDAGPPAAGAGSSRTEPRQDSDPSQRPSSVADALRPLGVPLDARGEIAHGGMGAIVRVHDPQLKRDLAMKVIRGRTGEGGAPEGPPPEWVERFVDEARIQAQLDHPGVVPIHHLGVGADGRVCFTMKLVRGRTLEDVIEEVRRGERKANFTRAVQVLLRLCETMAYAHDKGVIHRDLKPANVMVGDFGEVYVMDWGLAKVVGRPDRRSAGASAVDLGHAVDPASGSSSGGRTQVGAILGTPRYMPPEQAQARHDEVDERSDVYAIGSILYEMLAGRPPYTDPERKVGVAETIRAVLDGPPAPLAGLAPRGTDELVAIAEKAMARAPRDRYASAREMGQDLQRWLEGRVVTAHRTGIRAEVRKWVQRNRAIAGLAAAFVIVLAWASFEYWRLDRQARTQVATERDAALRARDAADAARHDAVAAARRADGLRLCAIASTLADKNPTLAALLALEGAERAPGPEATTALYAAMRDFTEVRTLAGHDAYVLRGAWSPDGSRVLTVSQDGRLFVWDPQTGRTLHRAHPIQGTAVALEFVDGGRRVLVAGTGGRVAVLDLATVQTVAEIRTGGIEAASVSADGTRIATAEGAAGARVYDVATGREVARFEGHAPGGVAFVRFAPDGRSVATGGTDLHVRVWDAATGRETAALPAFDEAGPPIVGGPDGASRSLRDAAPSVAWSPDGGAIVTSARPETAWAGRGIRRVRIHDAATGAERLHGRAPRTEWIDHLGFTPDGRAAVVLVAQPAGRNVHRLVDLATGEVRAAPWSEFGADWSRPRYSPDRRHVALAAGSFQAAVWSADTGAQLRVFTGHRYDVSDLAFSPDGTRLLTCSHDMTARIWEVQPEHDRPGVPQRLEPGFDAESGGSDDAGRTIGVHWRRRGARDGRLELLDTTTGRTVLGFGPTTDGGNVIPSPDGRAVAVRREGLVDVLDVASGRSLFRLELDRVGDVRFGPTGRQLVFKAQGLDAAAPDLRDAVYVQDLDAGGAPRRYDNPDPAGGGFQAIAVSADGRYVGAAHGYTGPVVWDAASGAVLHHLHGHTGMVLAVAFSPDARRLASQAMDSTVRVWDVATGELVSTYRGMPMRSAHLAFSPDGGRVLAMHPGAVVVIDAETGREVGQIPSPSAFARLSVAPDGRVVTVLRDGGVRLWPLDPGSWLAVRAPRSLGLGDRDQYDVGDEHERLDREIERAVAQPSAHGMLALVPRLLRAGRAEDADRAARLAVAADPEQGLAHVATAYVAAGAGDADAAFAALRRASGLGESLRRFAEDPGFAPLRGDPRWAEVTAR